MLKGIWATDYCICCMLLLEIRNGVCNNYNIAIFKFRRGFGMKKKKAVAMAVIEVPCVRFNIFLETTEDKEKVVKQVEYMLEDDDKWTPLSIFYWLESRRLHYTASWKYAKQLTVTENLRVFIGYCCLLKNIKIQRKNWL